MIAIAPSSVTVCFWEYNNFTRSLSTAMLLYDGGAGEALPTRKIGDLFNWKSLTPRSSVSYPPQKTFSAYCG
ncbi:MAG: hypothetical protein KME60_03660 [Cyanomargarita calcarea GSE-NOS-MK-12-04C]|jgi:hypothetical protein|uniref:Uncharacterized protein n=1 Tax=Cyanomargarita calcarea GSE-NOS-MK-12-04C TaxID=2839659 RepID=A0A951QIK0_9CYAN|nr:hypothetical protein [Cyanomargarita calcarea GSE-NOS-MK-12-04C]